MNVIIALFTAGILALGAPAAADTAYTETFRNGTAILEMPDRKVKRLELRYFEPMPRGTAYVEFNDGSALRFAPCKYEDSPRCYWDAGSVGSKSGTSFIRFAGKTFRL